MIHIQALLIGFALVGIITLAAIDNGVWSKAAQYLIATVVTAAVCWMFGMLVLGMMGRLG